MISTGFKGILKYGYEESFKTGTDNINKTFGLNQRVGSISFEEDIDIFYTIGSRIFEGVVYGAFEGSMSIDFYLANPWFFKALLNNYSVTDNGDGTYTHTFSIDNTIPSLAIATGTTEAPLLIKGAVVTSASISTAVDEVVSVSLDIVFAEAETLKSLPSGVVETFKPFTFAHGALTKDNNQLALVQNIEITINNDPELLKAIGSRTAQDYVVRKLSVEGRMSIIMQDNSWLVKALENLTSSGPSKIADNLKLSLNNNEQKIDIILQDVYLTSLDFEIPQNEKIVYEIPFKAKNISISATNKVASIP